MYCRFSSVYSLFSYNFFAALLYADFTKRMAYLRNWRKRNAEVLVLAEDSLDSEDALDGMLESGASVGEDESV